MKLRLSLILAGLLGFGSLASESRAGYVYAYAQQQITKFNVTGTGVNFGPVTVGTSTTANQLANPPGTSAFTNTPTSPDSFQSYVGPGPAPAQNFFAPVGLTNNDYTRGDVIISNSNIFSSPGTGAVNNVAEGYLVSPPGNPDTGSANGAWSITTSFVANSSGAVVSYSGLFNNSLRAASSGAPGQFASAGYTFDFSITDLSNPLLGTIYHSSPSSVNTSVSLNIPFDTTYITNSGSFGATTAGAATFIAGHVYSISIQGAERVNLIAVPEPSSFALVGVGTATIIGLGYRRRTLALREASI